MFRVTGQDGTPYFAPDVMTLQQWVDEGRVTPHMIVEDMTLARRTAARDIAGLRWPGPPPGVDPRNVPRYQPAPVSAEYPRYEGANVQAPLLKAILTTLFCCMPLGIVSIVYASQVGAHLSARNHAAAEDAARKAHTWANASMAVGALWIIVNLLFVFGAVALGAR